MSSDQRPVDGELPREAISLRERFVQSLDGGTSPNDPGLADLELDNIARAIGEGIPLASYALGIAAVQRLLRREVKK